jgi:protein-tyrosine-phosphatase/predicted ATP-grasp superfamily ATP-dependent carboligase
MKVLVLGHDTCAFLAVIRSLGRGGVEVHVAWHDPDGPASQSRYIRKAHLLPSWKHPVVIWKPSLQRLLVAEKFDLVLPCIDPIIMALHQHRNEFEQHGRIYLLSDTAFEVTFDKFKTADLARSLEIPVAHEVIVRSATEIDRIRAQFELPVVLKPKASFGQGDVERQMVRKAYCWEAMERHVEEMCSRGPVSVQENFIGRGVGVELLMNNGEMLMAFQHVRLHEPMHGGGSSYRMSVPLNPDLVNAAVRILGHLHYTGVAMVEFKMNPETGRWLLIEINGRFWGSLPLAVAAGADFPLALAQLLVEGKTCFPREFRTGICCRNFRADLGWQRANLHADRTDPTLASLPLSQVLWETVRNVVLLRERSDTFTWDDPMPGFAEIVGIVNDGWKTVRRKIRSRYLQLPWVRRKLRARALTAFAQSNTIGFVCKGNICRSPFAERFAKASFGPGRTFISAGLYSKTGRRAPEMALYAAAQWDIDLSGHRSAVVDPEFLARAEAIFIFDDSNFDALQAQFPEARRKIHFLGALKEESLLFISDPFGKLPEVYEMTCRQIAEILLMLNPARQSSCPKTFTNFPHST